MTYRIVKIEPCAHPKQGICVTDSEHLLQCHGCRGDGTRTVEVAVIERAPDWWWSPMEQAATAGTWGHGDDRAVWVEVES